MSQHKKLHRREAGMTLVELMVGMLIGLIGIVIITHLYVTNDQYKRSTTGAGSAHINGAVALYSLEREIRMAGYGISHALALGCKCNPVVPLCSPLQYHFNGNSSFPPAAVALGALPARNPVPVQIADNPGAGPDAITILYSSSNERVLPAAVTEESQGPNHDYRVDYTHGFAVNNVVLVATESGTCMIKQITGIQPGLLEHRTGAFNPPGTFGPQVLKKTAIFNLGTPQPPDKPGGPAWRTFFIQDNKLQSDDFLRSLQQGTPFIQQLVEDIVDLQAQYGKDMIGNDRIVDTWDTVLPDPDKDEWRLVLAIRVGVLARSEHYEKPAKAGDPCTSTETAPTWSGGTFSVPGGIPSCYKYRAFETVIPLRNMIWRQE